MSLKPGKYKHYKGGEYRVLFVAKGQFSSGDLDMQDMVVYESVEPNEVSQYWVRPLSLFLEEVEVGGKMIPRFSYLG